MVSSSGSGSSDSNSSFTSRLKNCEGCQKRKEVVMSPNFWLGIAVGVAGTWAYHKYVKK